MLEFGDKTYVLDIDVYSSVLTLAPKEGESETRLTKTTQTYLDEKGEITSSTVTETEEERGSLIDSNKSDLLRTLVDTVFMSGEGEDSDDTLGSEHALKNAGVDFKIAFNTLIAYKILKEIEL